MCKLSEFLSRWLKRPPTRCRAEKHATSLGPDLKHVVSPPNLHTSKMIKSTVVWSRSP